MSVEIGIHRINEEEFKFSDQNLDSIDSKALSLAYHLSFKVDVERNVFTVKFSVNYNYDNCETKEMLQLLKFTTSTEFKVEGLKEIVKFNEEDENKFQISNPLMITFVGTAISSARGMLAYKLAGTILASYYLPLVDVQALLKDGGFQSEN